MDRRRVNRRGMVLCAASAVLFGAATPISRRLLVNVDSVMLAGLLYVGDALTAGPFALRQPRPQASRSEWARLAFAVIIGGGVAPVLLLLGLERVAAPTVSLLLNLELVATVIIAGVVFHDRLDLRSFVGVVLIVVAGTLLAWTGGTHVNAAALLVVLACIGWGIDNAITANLEAFSPAQIGTAKGVVAGATNLTIGLMIFDGAKTGVLVALAALGVGAVGYGASSMLWIAGARLIGAARGQAVYATAPFVGVLLAWPIVGERLQGQAVWALLLTAFGVVLLTEAHLPNVHRHGSTVHVHRDGVAGHRHSPSNGRDDAPR